MGCCHFAFNFVANDFRMVLSTENNGSDYICASVVDVSLEWLHSYAYTYAKSMLYKHVRLGGAFFLIFDIGIP